MAGAATDTLGERLRRADSERFVGRERELEELNALLGPDPEQSVAFVHGPGGVGKSALVREVVRRAADRGFEVFAVEGRDLPPVPDALDEALTGAERSPRPLVVIDTYERMAALDRFLRQSLLPSLPSSAVVLIAGRRPPTPDWREGGWERLTVDLRLGPLPLAESLELTRSLGIADESRARAVCEWAGGSPLALTLAAPAVSRTDWEPGGPAVVPAEAVEALAGHLTGSEVGPERRGTLAAAAIARVTTEPMLADVLPDQDPSETYSWLAGLSFAEPLAEGITLHELVRRAVKTVLDRREPELARDLRRRIADHLYARAISGNPLLTIELQALVENAAIRAAYSWDGAGEYVVERVRDGDTERIADLMARRGAAVWWERTRRIFDEAPERVAVARDTGGAIRGYVIAVTTANAPGFASEDELLGPWLDHARSHGRHDAILWRDAVDFTRSPEAESESRLLGMLNVAGVLRSGMPNPGYAYLPIDPSSPVAVRFAEALGATHVPELDVRAGEATIECRVLDYGPGGLLRLQRDMVYLELGLSPPAAGGSPAVTAEEVREVLRQLDNPLALARSPLASGASHEERAASVRSLVLRAADEAFGASPEEGLLRAVLVRGYLDRAPSHELAADELHLSRATYFRRLRRAVDRIAEYLAS